MADLAVLILVVFVVFCDRKSLAMAFSDSANVMTLDHVRDALIRQEDTIIFSLIERAKFPFNSPTYDQSKTSIPGFCGSLVQFIVKHTEAAQAKAGRFQNPEEHPFFPDDMPPSLVPPYDYPVVSPRLCTFYQLGFRLFKSFDDIFELEKSGDIMFFFFKSKE